MLTVVVGISGALIFGFADFFGGLGSRRINPIIVTAIAALAGLLVLVLLLPFVGGVWSASAVLWGALSGVAGAIAIVLLYACLAIGPMSILSPLTAIVSAIIPLAWGLLGGERLQPLGYLALGIALIAVVLVGFVPEKGAVRPSLRGVLMAIGSGLMIGVFLILIDQSPADSGLIPLLFNRITNAAIMATIIALLWFRSRARDGAGMEFGSTREGPPSWRLGVRFALICGVIDAVGNGLLLLGIRLGELSVMGVLTAMYPAGTILLAAVVLKERIAPVQWAGLGFALSAAGLLSLG